LQFVTADQDFTLGRHESSFFANVIWRHPMKTHQPLTPHKVALATALAVAQIGMAHAQASNDTLKLDEVVVTGTATGASKMKQSSSISTAVSYTHLRAHETEL
jgi:hypothetical protein